MVTPRAEAMMKLTAAAWDRLPPETRAAFLAVLEGYPDMEGLPFTVEIEGDWAVVRIAGVAIGRTPDAAIAAYVARRLD